MITEFAVNTLRLIIILGFFVLLVNGKTIARMYWQSIEPVRDMVWTKAGAIIVAIGIKVVEAGACISGFSVDEIVLKRAVKMEIGHE